MHSDACVDMKCFEMVQIKLIFHVRSLGLMLLIAAIWLIDIYNVCAVSDKISCY